MWTYRQGTGELLRDGVHVGTGYSGHEEGRNNPDLQHARRVGPIPIGFYEIGDPYDSKDHGPYVLRLTPHHENNMFGRDGFLIHGDSREHPGEASQGCIIQSRDVRMFIGERIREPFNERMLEVVRL